MAAFLEFHRSTTLFSNIFGSKHYLKKSKMAAFLEFWKIQDGCLFLNFIDLQLCLATFLDPNTIWKNPRWPPFWNFEKSKMATFLEFHKSTTLFSNIFGSKHYLKKSKMAAFLEFWKSKMATFLEFHRSTTLFSNIFGSEHYLKKSKMAAFLEFWKIQDGHLFGIS